MGCQRDYQPTPAAASRTVFLMRLPPGGRKACSAAKGKDQEALDSRIGFTRKVSELNAIVNILDPQSSGSEGDGRRRH
jgi:hypothetical protein